MSMILKRTKLFHVHKTLNHLPRNIQPSLCDHLTFWLNYLPLPDFSTAILPLEFSFHFFIKSELSLAYVFIYTKK